MNKATPTAATATTAACPLVNNEELSELIVAESVVALLDRQSIMELMKIPSVVERFHLTKYYCAEHGTKLEVAVMDEESSIGGAEEDDDNSAAGESGVGLSREDEEKPMGAENATHDSKLLEATNADIAVLVGDKKSNKQDEVSMMAKDEDTNERREAKFTCVDCIQAKKGNKRCPNCDNFSSGFFECFRCNWLTCNECVDLTDAPKGECDTCAYFYCGREGCPELTEFPCCGMVHCDICSPVQWCDHCEGYACKSCTDNFYYDETNPAGFCQSCQIFYCGQGRDCRRVYLCGNCFETHCEGCRAFTLCLPCQSVSCNHPTCKLKSARCTHLERPPMD